MIHGLRIIHKSKKKYARKQSMIEFMPRELPKIAQKQTLFLKRSQIKVNSCLQIICPSAELFEFQLIDFFRDRYVELILNSK